MIAITANTRQATVTGTELITSGSAGIPVQFYLSDDWNGLVKTAVFRNGDDINSQIDIILSNELVCSLPVENCNEQYIDDAVMAGIYGSDGNGTVIIPTVWVSLGVLREGAKPGNASGSGPTPDLWAQIVQIAETSGAENAQAALEAQTAAETAQGLAETAQDSAETYALKAEGYAVGKQNNEDVESGSPYYQNNADYYATQAGNSATSASDAQAAAETAQGKAEDAQDYAEVAQGAAETAQGLAETAQAASEAAATEAESWAIGGTSSRTGEDTNNSKYWSEQAAASAAVFVIDDTLTQTGEAADAKATGDAIATKVDKVSGKGLSTNDYSTAEKTKLAGIEAGAEVNVQSDWNQYDSTADDFIKNKPVNLVQDASYVHTDNNYTSTEKTKLSGIAAGAEVNVQSDWNQTTEAADDFIKNKPANLVQDASYVHTDNNYTSDEKTKLSGIEAGAEVNDVTSVNTKTGAVVLGAGDIGYDETETYSDDTVGAALQEQAAAIAEQEEAIADLSINKADVIVSSASGAIASFSDGMATPIKGMVVNIDPVQDLHGYPSPWPAGGGKNLFDKDNVNKLNAYVDGTIVSSSGQRTIYIPCKPNTTYTAQKIAVAAGTSDRFTFAYTTTVPANGVTVYEQKNRPTPTTIGQKLSLTLTTGEDAQYLVLWISQSEGYDASLSTTMIEEGSTASAWQPFSNICPISGHTGVTVYRTGTNLFDRTKETVGKKFNAQGGIENNVTFSISDYVSVIPSETYYFVNVVRSAAAYAIAQYDADKNFISVLGIGGGSGNTTSGEKTLNAKCRFIRICYAREETEVAINYPITATDFEPYQGNTYPITFPSANIWDEEWEVGGIDNSTGAFITASDRIRSKNYIPCVANTRYYVATTETLNDIRVSYYTEDKTFISNSGWLSGNAILTPANTAFMAFILYGKTSYSNDIAINFPTFITTYSSHSTAQTVFGGTLKIKDDGSGTLTITKASLTNISNYSWQLRTGDYDYDYFTSASVDGRKLGSTDLICSAYKTASGGRNTLTSNGMIATYNATNSNSICIRDDAYDNATAFANSLTDVQLVYELASPVTIPLTKEQVNAIIRTLYGDNNVWSDTGDVSIEFRADTKLYIEKLTQPTEDDMVANTNITSGKFFMVGNNLFLSTASIASGEAIVPGTNCTALSLADALNNLNT